MEKFTPKSRQETLGYEIAQNLGDMPNLTLYVAYCKKYPEHIVREAYDKTMAVPIDQIKKSRSALFHFFIKLYVHNNPSDQTGK